uniref:PHD-type domain-containing protein n=1 Tax=Romanomermis culicivorax TaxID=13658 RepID=A0A915IAE9_ROMCU
MAHTKSRKGSTTTQSAINNHQVNDANCTICATIVQDNDRAILCEYCNNWFHCKCTNIANQVYDYLKASNQLPFCPSCLPAVNQFPKLNKRFDNLENRITSLVKELVAKITGLEQKLAAAQQKSTVPSVYSTDFLVSIGKNTLEAEAKKDTAVFLNFRTDDNEDLLSEVKDFAKAIGFNPKEIIGAKHSGLEVTRNNVTLLRIVKVKCASITVKNDLIKNVNLSQKNIQRSEKIRARPDLTFAEREQGRLL